MPLDIQRKRELYNNEEREGSTTKETEEDRVNMTGDLIALKRISFFLETVFFFAQGM